MARPGRPVSEHYQPIGCSVSQSASYSSEAKALGPEDGDDHTPIFSLSKSYVDVVMATGPSHWRDSARARVDLKRSSSTNTHAERNSVTLQQLHPRMWQHINSTRGHQSSSSSSSLEQADAHVPPALSERWLANRHRWSACSSTHSRSSTPDTVVWRGGTSRPSSLTQETPWSPRSPGSKTTSSPTTPSPFTSPLQTPTLPLEGLLTSPTVTPMLRTHQQQQVFPRPSALLSPSQAQTSPVPAYSPDSLQLPSTEDEGFLDHNYHCFTFPSPIPSSVSLAEAGSSSGARCPADEAIQDLHSPGLSGPSGVGGDRSPQHMFNESPPTPPEDERESGRGASVGHLELPWQPGPSRSPLVSSLSDSLLGRCCRCNLNAGEGVTRVWREAGTMTSRAELADAAVQTISPVASLWVLGRNMPNSNMGSHSLLGSPPGSRLNLKSFVGSNSNLVSPSSSMFPMSSCDEEVRRGDDPAWEINSASSHDLERRRSCLKMKMGEEGDVMERRGSMKQVQWDEDGMTWDVHGASLDPEVLSTAIQKHLELQNSPRTPRLSLKKNKAPKPPLIGAVVKAIAPDLQSPAAMINSTGKERENKGTPEEAGEEEKGRAVRRISRAEAAYVKEDDEVYGGEGTTHPKSPVSGSGHACKKGVIRSLKKPGWCGGSRREDD